MKKYYFIYSENDAVFRLEFSGSFHEAQIRQFTYDGYICSDEYLGNTITKEDEEYDI